MVDWHTILSTLALMENNKNLLSDGVFLCSFLVFFPNIIILYNDKSFSIASLARNFTLGPLVRDPNYS
jgi:hypothetical protein